MLRGEFSLLSTAPLDGKYELLSNDRLTGQACYDLMKMSFFIGEGVFDQAVIDALADQPDETLLVDAEFVDEGACVVVTGLPARLK